MEELFEKIKNKLKKIFFLFLFLLITFNFFGCKYFTPKDEKDFAVTDTSLIQKIFITDKGKHQILLTREKNIWKVNKKYIARKDAIDLLLAGMQDIRVNRPASISEHNNVVKEMASSALKVEIFTKEKEPVKTYYVGSIAKNYQGNYYLMEGSEQPYVVEIPGFNGEVSVRYIKDEMDWRDRTICKLLPSEIKSVEVTYFDERKSESFKIEEKNLNEFIISPNGKPDQKKCFSLFGEFRKLNSLGFVLDIPEIEPYKNKPPFVVINIIKNEGNHQTLELTHVPLGKRSKKQYDAFGKPMSFDSENYYGWINNHTDFIMIQDFSLRNILKLRKDFLK